MPTVPECPLFFVITAPSGAGKSTLIKMLRKEFTSFVYSVSCTTRAPRGAEQDGVDYHFLPVEEFMRRVEAGDFLEHACVHGNHYGTLKEAIQAPLQSGKSVLLDIDVAGAGQVRDILAALPENDLLKKAFIDVFIDVPSLEILRSRLEKRGEDAPEVIEKRLANAEGERSRRHEFSAVIVNDILDTAYGELRDLVLRKNAALRQKEDCRGK